MAKVFITLTGTKHYFGNDFLEKGTKIRLEKEPDNGYDKEAIKVTYKGLGKIGYVANSSYTVIGESMSAGRLYDKIGDVAYARVVLVTPVGTICKICKKYDEEFAICVKYVIIVTVRLIMMTKDIKPVTAILEY